MDVNMILNFIGCRHRRRRRKVSKEERLERKRILERNRKMRIKNDPVLRAELKRKDRERYYKKKAEGKIINRSQMDPQALQILRLRNLISSKVLYYKKKAQRNNKESESESPEAIFIASKNTE